MIYSYHAQHVFNYVNLHDRAGTFASSRYYIILSFFTFSIYVRMYSVSVLHMHTYR